MQFYTIYFDTSIMKMNAEILNVSAENSDELDVEIKKILNANGYEFLDYSDEIAILVDDQGLFKEGLPVFEVVSTYGDINKLAGKLVFVRNIENEFSTDIGSITIEDVLKLKEDLIIKLVGFTKGVF